MKMLLISAFDQYNKRAKYILEHMKNKNVNCHYITSNFNHINKTKFKAKDKDVIQIKTLTYKKNISIKRLLSHIIFSWKAKNIVKKIKPQIIYVILPPNALAYFISKFAKKNDISLIFDVFDMWPESFPLEKYKRKFSYLFKYWSNIRNLMLNNAEIIVTECDFFYDQLRHFVPGKIHYTLYPTTSYEANELIEINRYIDSSIDIHLCYLGSINYIIDIDLIVNLLSKIQLHKNVILHIIGEGENRMEFINLLEKTSIKYFYYGKIFDQKEKQIIFDKCAFGINIFKKDIFVGLTLKSIDYFKAGLPIINNIKSDTEYLVDKYKAGINISNNFEGAISNIIKVKNEDINVMSKNSLALYKDNFSFRAIENKISQIFDNSFFDNEKK